MMFFRFWSLLLASGFALAADQCSLLCTSGVCCNGPNGNSLCCPTPNGVCCESAPVIGLINLLSRPIYPQLITEDTFEIPMEELKSDLGACSSFCGDLCCPLERGVCCGDGVHCCPSGYQCDFDAQTCRISLQNSITVLSNDDRRCPSDDSGCPVNDTCCIMFDGSKGCCPHADATCCADGFHCCPRGTRCSPESDSCELLSGQFVNPFESAVTLNNQEAVKCPDQKSACLKNSTCCQTSGANATYACCPFENAVCCDDGQHCCPNGYSCDSRNGGACILRAPKKLTVGAAGVAWESHLKKRLMCDARTFCEGPNVTCCKTSDDSWGCCPYEDAVCCDDLEHCCPSGFSCGPSGKCLRFDSEGDIFLPWTYKGTAKSDDNFDGVKCSDGKTTCPDNSTCCQIGDRLDGCCPLPDAVCCPDREHCCPQGYRCDVGQSSCIKIDEESSPPPTNAQPLTSRSTRRNATCRPGETSCSADGGETSCCPIENAVCCSDAKHCCPRGFSCTQNGQCFGKSGDGLDESYVRAPRLLPRN